MSLKLIELREPRLDASEPLLDAREPRLLLDDTVRELADKLRRQKETCVTGVVRVLTSLKMFQE